MLVFVSHDFCGTRMFMECFEDEQHGYRFYGYDFAEHGKEMADCPRCHLLLDQSFVQDITAELPGHRDIPCIACGERAPLICGECGASFCFPCYATTHVVPLDLPYVHLALDDTAKYVWEKRDENDRS